MAKQKRKREKKEIMCILGPLMTFFSCFLSKRQLHCVVGPTDHTAVSLFLCSSLATTLIFLFYKLSNCSVFQSFHQTLSFVYRTLFLALHLCMSQCTIPGIVTDTQNLKKDMFSLAYILIILLSAD